MMTAEENDLLCRVEGDAPMGQIMRRHWIAACLSEEVAEPDGAPIKVRLLGEDLVVFRDQLLVGYATIGARSRQLERQHILGANADIDCVETRQRPQQQARAGEQHHADGKLRHDHRLMAAIERLMKQFAKSQHVRVDNVVRAIPLVAIAAGAGTNSFVLGDVARQATFLAETHLLAEKYGLIWAVPAPIGEHEQRS